MCDTCDSSTEPSALKSGVPDRRHAGPGQKLELKSLGLGI